MGNGLLLLTTETLFEYTICSNGKNEVLHFAMEQLQHGDGLTTLYCANPHSLVVADRDRQFKKALLSADILLPDGAGILLASRILGKNIRARITGYDFFEGLCGLSRNYGRIRFFFLGATQDVLDGIKKRITRDYPLIEWAGFSPPFKAEFSADDNRQMVEAIVHARPDVLWVGMTAPKQEKWIHANRHDLPVKLACAVGAVFDYYAGTVRRPHPFFRKLGLEWLPRLCMEPKRLWRRNMVSTPLFLFKILRALTAPAVKQ